MQVRTRTRADEWEDAQDAGAYVTVTVTVGAGETHGAQLPRAGLIGRTHGEIVRMALDRIGPNEPFVLDTMSTLDDPLYSLELAMSGTQSIHVERHSPIDATSLKQNELRYELSQDHIGGI